MAGIRISLVRVSFTLEVFFAFRFVFLEDFACPVTSTSIKSVGAMFRDIGYAGPLFDIERRKEDEGLHPTTVEKFSSRSHKHTKTVVKTRFLIDCMDVALKTNGPTIEKCPCFRKNVYFYQRVR